MTGFDAAFRLRQGRRLPHDPVESGQFAGHRRTGLHLELAAIVQIPVSATEPLLRVPGDGLHLVIAALGTL